MKMITWWMPILFVFSLPLCASNLFQPMELSDHELAQLRGRYILPDRIISFGVVMTSTWENASGQVIGAQVGMSLTSGQSQPVLYATPIEQMGSETRIVIGSGQIIGGAGLDSVRGIVQSVRVAGDGNHGENGLSVRISSDTSAPQPIEGQAWSNGQVLSNSAGTVRISNPNGGLAITIQAGSGQGGSSQQIGSGGMAQHSAIGGNLNTVRNLASLDVRLRESPQSVNLRSSLEQLRIFCPTR